MVNGIMTENRKTGHRQRLRDRFLADGPQECSDEMLLELLLTFAIGRKDVRPIAQGLDVASFRRQIEELHDRGRLRYETTHNLDQIRLKPGFSALEFLTAHFEDRDPREDTKPSPGGIFQ